MTRSPDILARKALAFDLSVRERRELERKALAYDRLVEWLRQGWEPELDSLRRVSVARIFEVLEAKGEARCRVKKP